MNSSPASHYFFCWGYSIQIMSSPNIVAIQNIRSSHDDIAFIVFICTLTSIGSIPIKTTVPVVPQKAVAEVSKIGNL